MQGSKSELSLKIIGGALLSALSFLSVFTLHPLSFLSMGFTPLALYYLALGHHPYAGAGAAGTVCCALSIFFGPSLGLFYLFLFGGPLILMAFFKNNMLAFKDKHKPYLSLEKLVLGNVSYFCGVVLLLIVIGKDFFGAEPAQIISQVYQNFPEIKSSLKEEEARYIKNIIPYLPGVIALWGSLMAGVNGVLALNLLTYHKRLSISISSLSSLKLPFRWWGVLAGVGVLTLLDYPDLLGLIAKNLILVLLVPFLVEGLSVLSVWGSRQKNRSFFLWLMIGMIFILNFLLLGVVILGIFEPWLNLRQKIKDRRRNQ